MDVGFDADGTKKHQTIDNLNSLFHLGKLAVQLGYLAGVVVDEVSRALDAVEPAADHGRQLALGGRQLLPKIRTHLGDVLGVDIHIRTHTCGDGGKHLVVGIVSQQCSSTSTTRRESGIYHVQVYVHVGRHLLVLRMSVASICG